MTYKNQIVVYYTYPKYMDDPSPTYTFELLEEQEHHLILTYDYGSFQNVGVKSVVMYSEFDPVQDLEKFLNWDDDWIDIISDTIQVVPIKRVSTNTNET